MVSKKHVGRNFPSLLQNLLISLHSIRARGKRGKVGLLCITNSCTHPLHLKKDLDCTVSVCFPTSKKQLKYPMVPLLLPQTMVTPNPLEFSLSSTEDKLNIHFHFEANNIQKRDNLSKPLLTFILIRLVTCFNHKNKST